MFIRKNVYFKKLIWFFEILDYAILKKNSQVAHQKFKIINWVQTIRPFSRGLVLIDIIKYGRKYKFNNLKRIWNFYVKYILL